MAGTAEGAAKAVKTNKQKDPNFYAKIGSKSWEGERDHKVGFANLDEETHKEISRKGGSKTKEEYKTRVSVHEEPKANTGVSE